MNKIAFIIFVVILIGGVIFVLQPSDEKKIRANLVLLAESGSSTIDEPMLESLQKVAHAVKLCDIPFTVTFETKKIYKKFNEKELTDQILMVRKMAVGTQFIFEDVHVEILKKKRAEIVATLRLKGITVDGYFTDAYETHLTAQKRERKWLFSSFELIEFIEK